MLGVERERESFGEAAPTLAERARIGAEAVGDRVPVEAREAKSRDLLLVVRESVACTEEGLVEAWGEVRRGLVVGGGGVRGALILDVIDVPAALGGAVVACLAGERRANEGVQVGDDRGLGFEADESASEVAGQRARDGLADVLGIAAVTKASAHAPANEDAQEAEEFGEPALACRGINGRGEQRVEPGARRRGRGVRRASGAHVMGGVEARIAALGEGQGVGPPGGADMVGSVLEESDHAKDARAGRAVRHRHECSFGRAA